MERVELQIPAHVRFERVARASAAEIALACGFPHERVEDLKLAVSEAVTNAIEHGNRSVAAKLVGIVFVLEADSLEVQISDQGTGMDGVDPSRRVVDEQQLEQGMLRGFGMYLIHSLVDDCAIESSPAGTVLTLRLYRKDGRP